MAGTIINQRGTVRLKIGDQLKEMAPQDSDTIDVADLLGLRPMVDVSKLDQATFPPTMPKSPFRMFDVAAGDPADVGVNYPRTQTDSRLQGMLETHRDMEPVQHNGRSGQHAALQVPKSLVTVR